MRKYIRRAAPVFFSLIFVLAVSSCFPLPTPIPSASSINGTWRHSSNSDAGTITFHPDRSVTVTRVPEGVVRDEVDDSGGISTANPISLVGTWTIGNPAGVKRDELGDPFVQISFSANRYASGMNIVVTGSGSAMRLVVQAGDPDDYQTYQFARQ